MADRGATAAAPGGPAVADAHRYLVDRFTDLQQVLLEERDALLGRSPDRLETVVARKEALCRDISDRQQTLLGALQNITNIDAGYMRQHQERLRDYVAGLSNTILAIEQRMQSSP